MAGRSTAPSSYNKAGKGLSSRTRCFSVRDASATFRPDLSLRCLDALDGMPITVAMYALIFFHPGWLVFAQVIDAQLAARDAEAKVTDEEQGGASGGAPVVQAV
jgi:hypothetical protein